MQIHYMDTIIGILVFIFGTIIGSFLNVVILRYRSGRTLGGRSMCFTCGETLTWFELVPLGSFLTQRGKCAHCRAPISWQYPLVEALTGFAFVFLYFRFGYLLPTNTLLFAVLFAYYGFLSCLLIVLSVYDLKHKILPDGLTILFASVALIGAFFLKGDAVILHFPRLLDLSAGIILPAPFTLIWLASSGKWMGLGDSKLMIGIGFLLGLSSGIAALLLSFWLGAAISLLLILIGAILKRGKAIGMKTAVPFGPFLALGTFIVIVGQFDLGSIARIFGGSF